MDEKDLEKKIGDITHRNRLISDLLHDEVEKIEYGPLTLTVHNAKGEVVVTDFDDRRYLNIDVNWDQEWDEIIPQVTKKADDRVEQALNEL